MLRSRLPQVLLLAATLQAGCLSTPSTSDINGNDSGLNTLSYDITVQFGESDSETAVPLRLVMTLFGELDLVELRSIELRRGSKKSFACVGESLPVHASHHGQSIRIAPARVLEPDSWHCLGLTLHGHASRFEKVFRTRKVPAPTHEIWPPPNSTIPANIDSISVFSPDALEHTQHWHAALTDGQRVALATSARACNLDGETRSCLRYFPKRLLEDESAEFVVTRGDDFADRVKYSIAQSDHQRPQLQPLGCMPGATTNDDSTICIRETAADVSLLMQLDKPAIVSWSHGARSGLTRAPFGEVRIAFEREASVSKLDLFFSDVAGNYLKRSVGIDPTQRGPSLTISALRPNPRGPEPHQELLALYNHGQQPIELEGFRLGSTLSEAQWLPEHTVDAGQTVILVPPEFDPHQPDDTPPPVGLTLLRLEADITDRGVSNQGEQVQLWGPSQRWVSGVAALKVPAGKCLRRRKATSHTDIPSYFVVGSCFGPVP